MMHAWLGGCFSISDEASSNRFGSFLPRKEQGILHYYAAITTGFLRRSSAVADPDERKMFQKLCGTRKSPDGVPARALLGEKHRSLHNAHSRVAFAHGVHLWQMVYLGNANHHTSI
jgi:hypothetical protein